MSRARRLLAAPAVLAATLLATGCAAAVRNSARAPELTLVSATSFRLHATGGTPEGCTVQQAVVRVSAVRGDTIFFGSALAQKWPYGAPRCSLDGPGFVQTADHPELRAERLHRVPWWGNVLAVPYGIFAAAGALLLVLVALTVAS
jgi:hypothetical protein